MENFLAKLYGLCRFLCRQMCDDNIVILQKRHIIIQMLNNMKAILLAAGFSSRMGTLKQIMPIEGKPMIYQAAEPFVSSGLELLVVLGHKHQRVQEALGSLPCRVLINPSPEDGMFSSVRLGCQAVPLGEPCLLSTCDCPGVAPHTIRMVQETLLEEQDHVIIPTYRGRRGHPVGLPAFLVERVHALPPETPGLNSLWRKSPEMVVHFNVYDPAVLRDLDRREDVEKLQESCF
ncbi:hypothetical protein CSA56_04150 [candidate division KSB3 bacterium]|uniref:MobA-like NTP transferase domain-containing protein n=1 Tax=candidate division KSB3 bacterium TaxID=2044937 RepID=A0A2G6KIE0_9BACT|nr:MAG: hypothetical protein CSA56_04150 [candidate division KSB3 bacterium]